MSLFKKTSSTRKNLCIGDKIQVLHHVQMNPNNTAVGQLFGVSRNAIARANKSKDTVLRQEKVQYHQREIVRVYFTVHAHLSNSE